MSQGATSDCLQFSMTDIGWGGFLAAVCCTTGYLVARKLLIVAS